VWVSRLVHEAREKVSVRQRGPKTATTRQAVEGRKNNGGLRVGGMENDALVAVGGAMTQYDRNVICSDGHRMKVCAKCGQVAESCTDTVGAIVREVAAHGGDTAGVVVNVLPCRFCGTRDYMVDQGTMWCSGGLATFEMASLGYWMRWRYDDAESGTDSDSDGGSSDGDVDMVDGPSSGAAHAKAGAQAAPARGARAAAMEAEWGRTRGDGGGESDDDIASLSTLDEGSESEEEEAKPQPKRRRVAFSNADSAS
jgi:hypothetical protein